LTTVAATDTGLTVPAADERGVPLFLRGLWYFACASDDLRAGRSLAKTVLGEPVLLVRGGDGVAYALLDICPHRGIPLHFGTVRGREVECCYHGWRFGADGRCTDIPSLVEGQPLDPARIRVRTFPLAERQGVIWIFMADGGAEQTRPLPEPPTLPDVGAGHLHIRERMSFPCAIDHAVVGLMDPAHGPFVHRSWWWRPARSAHLKEKRFVPSELGFTMARHRPSSNSRAYKLLGGTPETEIAFRLPGIRIEHVRAGSNVLVGLTATTPVTATETEVNHLIYWTMPWLTPLAPFLRPFARTFLRQDRDVVVMQQEGLKHRPPLMLIDDADRPAKWYFRLKRAFAQAQADGSAFENPVRERTLRWRS
jgi:phenylpropionate dioxygenase-like ring-hydroxylating dioxygenase large terminal subunit